MDNLLREPTIISHVGLHWRDFPVTVPRTFRACAAKRASMVGIGQ